MKKTNPQLWKAINWLTVALFLNAGVLLWVYFFPLNAPKITHESSAVWMPKSILTDVPDGKRGQEIIYGYHLITETPAHIGPLALKKEMRFAGNNLTCNNCHLNAGRKIGSGSFIGVTNRFPQFRGRENKTGNMADRINGCMERSMSGKALPNDSPEMKAMIAYMSWLGDKVPREIV